MADKVRHVLGISGGKDSAALAIYMRDKVSEMEYFFTDTGAELPEVYEFLDRLEDYLGKPIVRVNAERNFDYLLSLRNGFLPSPQTRWCTDELKIKPFERFVGRDNVVSYIAIRADEDRTGYVSSKENITAVFPFRDDGIDKAGVGRILEQSGVGWPAYYEWRSRSGCYFCFFQRKSEWVELSKRHPELFEKAKLLEKKSPNSGEIYTWSQGETLDQLVSRASSILENEKMRKSEIRLSWQEILSGQDDDQSEQACLVCHL